MENVFIEGLIHAKVESVTAQIIESEALLSNNVLDPALKTRLSYPFQEKTLYFDEKTSFIYKVLYDKCLDLISEIYPDCYFRLCTNTVIEHDELINFLASSIWPAAQEIRATLPQKYNEKNLNSIHL
jgi:hypothetical protein